MLRLPQHPPFKAWLVWTTEGAWLLGFTGLSHDPGWRILHTHSLYSSVICAERRHFYNTLVSMLKRKRLVGGWPRALLSLKLNPQERGVGLLPRIMMVSFSLLSVPYPLHLFPLWASLALLAPSLEGGFPGPETYMACRLCSWTPSWELKEEVEFPELPKVIIMIIIISHLKD